MALALENLAKMEGDKAVLLGEMRELGQDSSDEHAKIVAKVESFGFQTAYFVGEEFRKVLKEDGKALCFSTSEELATYLGEHPLKGRTILVKGSRGTQMEKVIPTL